MAKAEGSSTAAGAAPFAATMPAAWRARQRGQRPLSRPVGKAAPHCGHSFVVLTSLDCAYRHSERFPFDAYKISAKGNGGQASAPCHSMRLFLLVHDREKVMQFFIHAGYIGYRAGHVLTEQISITLTHAMDGYGDRAGLHA